MFSLSPQVHIIVPAAHDIINVINANDNITYNN